MDFCAAPLTSHRAVAASTLPYDIAIVVHDVEKYVRHHTQTSLLHRAKIINFSDDPLGQLEHRLKQAGLLFASREEVCEEGEAGRRVYLVRATPERLRQEQRTSLIERAQTNEVDEEAVLNTAERIQLTHQILTRREGEGPDTGHGKRDEVYAGVHDTRIVADHQDADELDYPWVQAVFPVHDRKWNELFLKAMGEASYLKFPVPLLHALRDHYGEEVVWYTAWMRSYIQFLSVLTVIGIIVQILSYTPAVVVAAPLYAVIVEVLAILFIRAWERNAAGLRYKWRVEDVKLSRRIRRTFKGDHEERNPATGRLEPEYSWTKRIVKQLVTVLVVVLQLVVLTAIIALFFAVYVSAYEPDCIDPKYRFGAVIMVSVVWGLIIEAVNYTVFASLAEALTSWENYKYEFEHQQQYIFKVFVFFFMDNYLWYFLLTLVWIPQLTYSEQIDTTPGMISIIPWCGKDVSLSDKAPVWIARVSSGLFFYLFATQLLLLFTETYLPFLINKCRSQTTLGGGVAHVTHLVASGAGSLGKGVVREVQRRREHRVSQEEEDGSSIALPLSLGEEAAQVQIELADAVVALEEVELVDIFAQATQQPYSTFYDWADMTSQYGYIVFFSIVCPLAAPVCLLNNVLEIRADLFKVCHNLQRAVPSKTSSVWSWVEIQTILAYMSALIASAILVLGTTFADRWFSFDLDLNILPPPLEPSFKIYVMVVLEHFVLLLMYMAKNSLGATPIWVMQRKAIKGERKVLKLKQSLGSMPTV